MGCTCKDCHIDELREALSQAQRERDEARDERDTHRLEIAAGRTENDRLTRERDEARARIRELEAWRTGVYPELDGRIGRLTKERDEARAEVGRLKKRESLFAAGAEADHRRENALKSERTLFCARVAELEGLVNAARRYASQWQPHMDADDVVQAIRALDGKE